MYTTIGKIFNELFYDAERNTYILQYNHFDYLEGTDEDRPYITIPDEPKPIESKTDTVVIGEAVYKTPPSVIEQSFMSREPNFNHTKLQMGVNNNFYDSMLIEFMIKNDIFAYLGRDFYCISQLKKDLMHQYSKTIFYVLESKSRARLKYRYYRPKVIDAVTIADKLSTYGLVMLEPIFQCDQTALDLYPIEILNSILHENDDRFDTDFKKNKYHSIIEFIGDTVSLFIGEKYRHVLPRLLEMTDTLKEMIILLNEKKILAFYIYPILGYMFLQLMERLSDENFGAIDIKEALGDGK